MFERFTSEARAVVVRAKDESARLHHGSVGAEHLLLGLLAPDAGAPAALLAAAGLDLERARADVAQRVGTPPTLLTDDETAALRTVGIDVDAVLSRIEQAFGADALRGDEPAGRRWRRGRRAAAGPSWQDPGGRGRFTPQARKVIELSLREALRLHDNRIGAEHLLLGLLRDGRGVAVDVLLAAGVDLDGLRRDTTAARRPAA